MKPIDTLLLAIGGIAVALYFGAICYAGAAGLHAADETKPVTIPEFVALTITTVGGTLATFLGMALGFKQASGATRGAAEAVTRVLELSWPQTIAAWAYIASLVLALGFWAFSGFAASTATVIETLAKSILGLFGGALAVVLNVR
jgi:hypothetical protein